MAMSEFQEKVWAETALNPATLKFRVGDKVQMSTKGKEWSDGDFPDGEGEIVGFGDRGTMAKVEWEDENQPDKWNPTFLKKIE